MKNSKRLPDLESLILEICSVLREQNPSADLSDLYGQGLQALFLTGQDRDGSGLERVAEVCSTGRERFANDNPGDLYEYLRNFRLEHNAVGELVTTSNVLGRRNQGLFYTPDTIVDYIVTRTLEGLEDSQPYEYLDCTILDPAAGTGKFLESALHRLTERILSRMASDEKFEDEIRRRLFESFGNQSVVDEIGIENSIKVHLLNHCLYGVELDPIAARIAESTLLKSVSDVGFPIKPNIGNGNSLIGESSPINGMSRDELDTKHADLYRTDNGAFDWARSKKVFHWGLEFPKPFRRGGFDAVIGNPPYEVFSAKESGINERSEDRKYFRRTYRTCKGKINAYRLMLERGIDLLKPGGILGFIVPATVLADSSATPLRRMILDETELLKTVVIPEKAKIFQGVTQALTILVMKKGGPTRIIRPVYSENPGPISEQGGVAIPRHLLKEPEIRIPLIRTNWDLKLMDLLGRFPTLADRIGPGHVHQGEINLTVHRKFITDEPTGIPLVRGEHIFPFKLSHPFPKAKRLDWLHPEISSLSGKSFSGDIGGDLPLFAIPASENRRPAYKEPRLGTARVVNIDTHRRLKAAVIPECFFMGDMTNYIRQTVFPMNLLLGLLNSRLLNKRLKLTSTNNYISAAEIEALPVPAHDSEMTGHVEKGILNELEECASDSVVGSLKLLNSLVITEESLIARIIVHVTSLLGGLLDSNAECGRTRRLLNLLDALVLKAYQAEVFAEVLE